MDRILLEQFAKQLDSWSCAEISYDLIKQNHFMVNCKIFRDSDSTGHFIM